MPLFERTFAMVKPMGVHRGLIGAIIQRFENKGFKLVAVKILCQSEEHFRQHYKDLEGEPFFECMVKYISSGPVVAMVWEGVNVVKNARAMIGVDGTGTGDPLPGTIRGDYSSQKSHGSIIHASDSLDAAAREIDLWFPDSELLVAPSPTHPGFLNSFF